MDKVKKQLRNCLCIVANGEVINCPLGLLLKNVKSRLNGFSLNNCKLYKMNRNEFIEEVIEACQGYRHEVQEQYVEYYLLGISDNFVRIELRYFDEHSEVCTTLEFQNDEDLIESLIDEL